MSPVSNSAFSFNLLQRPSVVRFPQQPTRVIVGENLPDWHKAVISRMEQLLQLTSGWDGYAAPPVSLENVYFAIEMLRAICPSDLSAPQIVPGTSGDMQIEWHVGDRSVELHVRGPNAVTAWRTSAQNPEGEELELTNNFAPILSWIKGLSGDGVAAVTAAA